MPSEDQISVLSSTVIGPEHSVLVRGVFACDQREIWENRYSR